MENDFCEELKKVYKHSLFDNSTIIYQINGFMEALGINELEGEFKELGFEEISYDNNKYVMDTVIKKNDDYEIKVMRCKGKRKDLLRINGNVDNIFFSFDNIYSMKDLKHDFVKFKVIINIGNNYSMKIFNENGCTFCTFKRNYNDVSFFILYRNDFEIVLSMIMQFIKNPDYVISMYKKIQDDVFVKSIRVYLDDDIIVDNKGKMMVKMSNEQRYRR